VVHREEKQHPELMKLMLETSLPLDLTPFEMQLGPNIQNTESSTSVEPAQSSSSAATEAIPSTVPSSSITMAVETDTYTAKPSKFKSTTSSSSFAPNSTDKSEDNNTINEKIDAAMKSASRVGAPTVVTAGNKLNRKINNSTESISSSATKTETTINVNASSSAASGSNSDLKSQPKTNAVNHMETNSRGARIIRKPGA
jgi:hypothetical protein